MSARETWHKDAPKQSAEPTRPPAPFHWTRGPGIPANSALPQAPIAPGFPPPESTSARAPETDEIDARLLRAIEDTDIARRLGRPPTAIVRRPATEFRPPSKLLVQTPSAAAMPLMPPPTASSRRPAPAASFNPAPALPTALPSPSPSSPQPAAAPEPPPALTPPTPATSPDDLSFTIPITPSRRDELRPLAARTATIAARILHAVTHLATALSTQLLAVVCAAGVRMARAGARLFVGLGNWFRHTAVPATVGAVRAGIQHFIAFRKGLVHRAALARERKAHAAAQLSTARNQRTAPKPAPAAAPTERPAKQVSTRRFKYLFDPRHSPRLAQPPLVAWCWAADTPGALRIADISAGGIHLLTDVRWPRGASVPMTLQRTDRTRNAPGSWIVADFMILRWCQDGLAGSLIPPTPYSIASGTENCADAKTLKRFVKQLAVPARRY